MVLIKQWVINSRVVVLSLLLSMGLCLTASAQTTSDEGKTWTVNFKETNIQELIRFVAKATEKTIIIDSKVKGKVQVISAKPMNSVELYQLFLSILEIQGFAAVESGDVTRIIPSKEARTAPVQVVTEDMPISSQVITQVIQLENISAAKLIPVLRPLAPQQAHMAAYAPSNAIIISDTAANIARIKKVINSIDRSAVQKTDIVTLEHASAEEVVRMLGQLAKNNAGKGQAETKKLVLVADKRTNSVLVTGDELERQRVKTLIEYLDTPLAQSGNVKVVYLKYAEAKNLATVLSKVVQNLGQMGAKDKAGNPNKHVSTIEADEGTNSLIITAEADTMQSLLSVVERLDIRRAQVLVEAIIVEMRDDDGRDLGVEWLFLDKDSGAYGSSKTSGLSGAIAAAALETDNNGDLVDSRSSIAGLIGNVTGQVLGVSGSNGDLSFNVVLNALQANTKANILSTPSLMVLDNEEASIVVGQSISFVTGSYTSTDSSVDNAFQTVERENVGITLKVTPQINEGDSLILEISQEVSNVIGNSEVLNSNPVTSERKINTKVLADSGQIIVLGGLIEDEVQETLQKVPLLGDIPLFGALFRSTSIRYGKKHLLIFLRSTIVRDRREMDSVTAKKYRLIREQQLEKIKAGVDFIDDETLPLLPEWQEQLEALDLIKQKGSASVDAAPVNTL